MIRFFILLGFALMFAIIHQNGQLNMYINTKYAYLSISAIVLLLLLCAVEFVRVYRLDKAKERQHDHELDHDHEHDHSHDHDHDHDHFGLDHSHEPTSKWKRAVGYLILLVPICTGIFLPVQTLDSSFVKAKGFAFPTPQEINDETPGEHQFLKPDSSVFYGKEGYEKLKNKELADFVNQTDIKLDDSNYMKGMEVIYNFPGEFMGDTISFTGFTYKGEQADENHYFVFRFGFIHCVADSGVFGMLVEFPKGTSLNDDEWVHVTGKLASQYYQPFKQTIPVLRVTSWESIPKPEDPYVYRNY
ncbi:TIGR03943 family protein [Paenibacillus sp. LHD-117]|uniref:TIGR03943 family putative permease subunit n=1 Tax=Paenibacillus sp. LHD-117 TaxID=3071412 RepID=UPI0027DFB481|nr:TIGR03943 family protein [Paenibacillus sp. LHD-117]MDQ6423506.1 TIGR03943 family protein [Paenibacillus sp. LHD-117]